MTLYLDTSSLVKLYVSEEDSERVRAHVDRASIVATSMVAYAEARAAFARRRREGDLRPGAFAGAKRTFEADWPKYLSVQVTEDLARNAGTLAERYALRGFDSLHLASFLEVARRAGASDTEFSSFDVRLNRAARLAARHMRRTVRR